MSKSDKVWYNCCKTIKMYEPFETKKIVLAYAKVAVSLPWSLCCSHVQRPEQGFGTKKKREQMNMCVYGGNLAHTQVLNCYDQKRKLKLPQDPWRYLTVRWYLGHPLDFPGSLFLSWFSFSWPAVNTDSLVRYMKFSTEVTKLWQFYTEKCLQKA